VEAGSSRRRQIPEPGSTAAACWGGERRVAPQTRFGAIHRQRMMKPVLGTVGATGRHARLFVVAYIKPVNRKRGKRRCRSSMLPRHTIWAERPETRNSWCRQATPT